ncbi:hypothetical protein HHK36_030516 [Tetracentron sinense]|uniref:DUF4219 domain-containing protein n=1 Tax=Tetracentron sinense TaxID=13715 RepID=A0A835D1M3_TETSI|nr:hypothetical protein HHK36_030516 [Tetracentron sinense]
MELICAMVEMVSDAIDDEKDNLTRRKILKRDVPRDSAFLKLEFAFVDTIGKMDTMKLAHNAIVPDVLAEGNYEIWKVCLKSYLLAEDLWDLVNGTEFKPKATQEKFKTWHMKNAKALHAIQISCGPQKLSEIKEIDSAKDAWDHLGSTHQPPSEETILPSDAEVSPARQGITSNDYTESLPLFKAVYHGDWENAKKFIELHPDVVNDFISETKDTALHIAVVSGQVQLVEELVKLMREESLELKNDVQNTALHLAASSGITKMAEAMVKKNRNLLGIAGEKDRIPVVMASSCGHKDMVHYLYSVTAKEELNPETSNNGISLLTSAIYADIYGKHIFLLNHCITHCSGLDLARANLVLLKQENKSENKKEGSNNKVGSSILNFTRANLSSLEQVGIHVQLNLASRNIIGDIEKPHDDPSHRDDMITQSLERFLVLIWDVLKRFGM